jgi:hypothetical protein
LALVLEPQKHFGGFFCWRDRRLNTQVPVDFFELLRDETRRTVVAWENYTGVDPLKNVTPLLAETNTKSVQPHDLPKESRLVPVRRRPWVVPALAAVSFLSIALTAWQLTRRPAADITNPPGSPTVATGPVSPTPSATTSGKETQGEQAGGTTVSNKEQQPVGGGSASSGATASGATNKKADNQRNPAGGAAAEGKKPEAGAKPQGGGKKKDKDKNKGKRDGTGLVGPFGKR